MVLPDLIDKQGIRDQLYKAPNKFQVPFLFNQEQSNESLSSIIKTRSPGNAFIAGDPINGRPGVGQIGIGGGQIIIGEDYGNLVVQRVVNPGNNWKDFLRDTEHWDTDNSTAIVDTTNFKIKF